MIVVVFTTDFFAGDIRVCMMREVVVPSTGPTGINAGMLTIVGNSHAGANRSRGGAASIITTSIILMVCVIVEKSPSPSPFDVNHLGTTFGCEMIGSR